MTQDSMMPHTLHLHNRTLGVGTLIFLVVAFVVAGCAPAPTAPVTPPSPTLDPETIVFAREDVEIAAPLLVQTERNAASTGDMALLAALWAEDATIVEQRGTEAESDDYTFAGRPAILDRYLVAVAQNRPTTLESPPDAPVIVDDDSASMVNGVDTWTFVFAEGRWWIQGLIIAP